MHPVPQIAPVSDMHHKQNQLFDMMDKAPVILAQRSRPRAVLVSIEQWNQMVEELRRTRLLMQAKQVSERNNEADSWVEFETLLAQLAQHHDPALIQQIREGLAKDVVG